MIEDLLYKGYKIVPKSYNLLVIKAKGKGSVPTELRSQYTSIDIAKSSIDLYLARKEFKNVKNSTGSKT